jgi:hypothetical protein
MDVPGLKSSTQVAFEGLVIRMILQFIRLIACCRVLHRVESRDIHRHELSNPSSSEHSLEGIIISFLLS